MHGLSFWVNDAEDYLVLLALRNCPAAMASKMLLLPAAGTELASLNRGRSRGAGRGLRSFETYIDERAESLYPRQHRLATWKRLIIAFQRSMVEHDQDV